MTVENANFINQLNAQYPQPKDLLKEGDDHLRLLKKVLRNCFPKVDKGIDATADWFNGIFARVKVGSGNISLEKNQIKNLADGSDAQDAVTLKQLTDKINAALRDNIYRVGSLYITEENIDPGNIPMFAGTKWQRWGTGRALVGAGSATDQHGERQDYGLGMFGNFNNYIEKVHLPAITLGLSGQTDDQGNHQHTGVPARVRVEVGGKTGTLYSVYQDGATDFAGLHRHNFNARTEQLGNRAALGNSQPSQTAYIWKRIS